MLNKFNENEISVPIVLLKKENVVILPPKSEMVPSQHGRQ